jgi:cytochrome c-type biogenesis protein CcmH
VSLAPTLKAKADPQDTVFVFARAADGPRMPLAILRRQVKDLPLQFTLDDSMAMTPAAKLSSAQRVIVGARISKRGDATAQPGDLQGQSAPVAPGANGLKIEISQVVQP